MVIVGRQVTVTDTSTPANGVTIVGWHWDFGDGLGGAVTQNASYTYASAGTYSVKLRVFDSSGEEAQSTQNVTVT